MWDAIFLTTGDVICTVFASSSTPITSIRSLGVLKQTCPFFSSCIVIVYRLLTELADEQQADVDPAAVHGQAAHRCTGVQEHGQGLRHGLHAHVSDQSTRCSIDKLMIT